VCAGTGTESGYGTSTGSVTVAFDFKKTCFFFFLFNTVFLIQELARVTEMKRILTSHSAAERADAADLNRERAVHPWRHLDYAAPRRHTISSRSETRSGRSRISLADLSAPISPGQAYARAAAAVAGSGIFDSSIAFSPANTSTLLAGVGSMMPPLVLDAPIQQSRPAPEFLPRRRWLSGWVLTPAPEQLPPRGIPAPPPSATPSARFSASYANLGRRPLSRLPWRNGSAASPPPIH
jgi:hypothetical protein